MALFIVNNRGARKTRVSLSLILNLPTITVQYFPCWLPASVWANQLKVRANTTFKSVYFEGQIYLFYERLSLEFIPRGDVSRTFYLLTWKKWWIFCKRRNWYHLFIANSSNPIQDGPFLGCSRIGGLKGKRRLSLKSVADILHWWNLAQLYRT